MLKKCSLIILLSIILIFYSNSKVNIVNPFTFSASSNVKKSVQKIPTVVDTKKIVNLPIFPDKVKNKNQIVPNGWTMLDILKNDFNNDALLDIVGVVEHPYVKGKLYPRILFIYLNNGNGYSKSLINQYLIRDRDEGGVMGDPYQKLTAKNNTFTTHTFGGSAWKWSENNTFEYTKSNWFLLYEENIYGYGAFETSYTYNDYKLGIGKRRYTEQSPGKKNCSKLEFTVRLDKKPLLADFAYSNFWGIERLKAPVIKSFGYNKGVPHFKGNIPQLDDSDISFRNKDYIIYHISHSKKIEFLGVYSFAKKHLQIIARYSSNDSNGINLGDNYKIYKKRLYVEERIAKMIKVRENKKIKNQSEVVAVRLVSMNLDGKDKKILFKANNSKYKENKIIDDYLDYMSLDYEITGDEIIVEVYCGNGYPYYRMNLDGGNRKLIGCVPRGAW